MVERSKAGWMFMVNEGLTTAMYRRQEDETWKIIGAFVVITSRWWCGELIRWGGKR
jgi:hypothetical protein